MEIFFILIFIWIVSGFDIGIIFSSDRDKGKNKDQE